MNPQVALDPQLLKAFDLLIDLVKQLITLSTGIIALTVSFNKDVFRVTTPSSRGFMKAAWSFHVLSVVSGVLGFMAITGAFGRGLAQQGVYQGTITSWVGVQIITFAFATLFVIISGWIALSASARQGEAPPAAEEERSVL